MVNGPSEDGTEDLLGRGPTASRWRTTRSPTSPCRGTSAYGQHRAKWSRSSMTTHSRSSTGSPRRFQPSTTNASAARVGSSSIRAAWRFNTPTPHPTASATSRPGRTGPSTGSASPARSSSPTSRAPTRCSVVTPCSRSAGSTRRTSTTWTKPTSVADWSTTASLIRQPRPRRRASQVPAFGDAQRRRSSPAGSRSSRTTSTSATGTRWDLTRSTRSSNTQPRFLEWLLGGARWHENEGRLPPGSTHRAGEECVQALAAGTRLGLERHDLRLGPVAWPAADDFLPVSDRRARGRRKITFVSSSTGRTSPAASAGSSATWHRPSPAGDMRSGSSPGPPPSPASTRRQPSTWKKASGSTGSRPLRPVRPVSCPVSSPMSTTSRDHPGRRRAGRIERWSHHDVVYGPLWDVEVIGALRRGGAPIAVQVATPLAIAADMAGNLEDPASAAAMRAPDRPGDQGPRGGRPLPRQQLGRRHDDPRALHGEPRPRPLGRRAPRSRRSGTAIPAPAGRAAGRAVRRSIRGPQGDRHVSRRRRATGPPLPGGRLRRRR